MTGSVFFLIRKFSNLQLCLHEEEEEEEEEEYRLGGFGLRNVVDAYLQVLQKNTFSIFILFIGTIKNIPKCLICLKAL